MMGIMSSLYILIVFLLDFINGWYWIFLILFEEKPTLRFMLIEHRNEKRQFSCRQKQDVNQFAAMCKNASIQTTPSTKYVIFVWICLNLYFASKHFFYLFPIFGISKNLFGFVIVNRFYDLFGVELIVVYYMAPKKIP